MLTRTFVGFVADFPDDRADADQPPAGKELAQFIADRLRETGFAVVGPEDNESYSWCLDIKVDGIEFYSLVGLVGDMETNPPRQWLITNYPHWGWLRRIFSSAAIRRRKVMAVQRLCDSLHEIMSTDSRFSHIWWYDERTFDTRDDVLSRTP